MKRIRCWHWSNPPKARAVIYARGWGLGFWSRINGKRRQEAEARSVAAVQRRLQQVVSGLVDAGRGRQTVH